MNAALDWNLWKPFFTTLAVETVLVVAAALLLQRWILSMAWRRTIWQVAFLGLGLLTITEISGAGRAIWSWLPHRSAPKPDGQLLVESKVIGDPDLRMLLAQRLQAGNVQAVRAVPDNSPADEPVRWPGAIWLLGFGAAVGWMVLARLVFLIFVPRRRVRDERLLARVNSIAQRLGERRRVRVGETRGLAGPIAFGIFRPGISLPEGFTSRFTDEQQDAMLAHEMAHLAAQDPLWHALADLVTAMLWWHPLAWLAKQQLRAASEAAADEASLVVENGPNVLAECLVELGGRLTRTHSLGWLGMAGGDFRSGLGRRVKRLVSLSAQSWTPMRRSRVWMVRIAAPLALAALALAATVWAQPPLGGSSTLRQAFQRSVLGLALAAALPQTPTPSPETERIDWQPWSHEALAAARAEGKTVLVHFTADWALSAKVNEQTSLEVPAVRAKLRELGAIALRGDYTQDDETIASELRAFGRAGVPLTLVYPSDPSLPPQVLPVVLTPQIILDALSKKPASAIVTGSAFSGRNKAPILILQGKALQQAGKQAEARAKFEEALKLDPANQAARHYLSLLQQAAIPVETNSVSRTNLARTTPGREAIYRKLDSIRLKEVSFPDVSLNEVVKELDTLIKASDPDRKGINFIINYAIDSGRGAPLIDEATGLPQLVPFPTIDVVIGLTRPLRDVTLRQVLDAIMKCADASLWYSVEDYAVVISAGIAPPLPALHTRWFRVDPSTFSRPKFESLTTNMDQAIKEAISAPPVLVDSPLPGKVYRTSVTPTGQREQVNSEARRFFTKAGVDFTVPGKSLVFNERLGQMVVRATLQDLDIIDRAIQSLPASPPQVTIEVKFCEVSTEDTRALGFDWLLSNITTNNVRSQKPGWPLVSEFLNVLSSFSSPKTNSLTTGFLTDPQYRVVMRALEQRQGVNILTPPKVTMLSGRQAQVKTVNVRYVVTDLDLSQIVSNAATGIVEKREARPIAEQFELGPVLDVVPYVLPGGDAIQLTVVPTLTEFEGYDLESTPRREIITTADGRKEYVTVLPQVPPQPRPIFRKRQMVSSVIARDGQTIVLSGGSDLLLANPKNNEPLREGTKPPQEPKKTKLLIFVTATLIDPAGNRIHPLEDVPRGDPTQASTPSSR